MRNDPDQAFSPQAGAALTEVIAALFVAAALISGIVELTRRFAVTTVALRQSAMEARSSAVIAQMFETLARVEPGSLTVSSDTLGARIGSAAVRARLANENGQHILVWEGNGMVRRGVVPDGSRFAYRPDGLLVLLGNRDEPPLGVTRPVRDVAFDCRFDIVARACS